MIDKQSAWESAAFHLVPGALNTIVYVLIAYQLRNTQVPAIVAMLVASVFVLLPLELFLLVRGRSGTGLYLKQLGVTPGWPLYLLTAVVSSLLPPGIVVPFEPTIKAHLFAWVPPWAQLYSLEACAHSVRLSKFRLQVFPCLFSEWPGLSWKSFIFELSYCLKWLDGAGSPGRGVRCYSLPTTYGSRGLLLRSSFLSLCPAGSLAFQERSILYGFPRRDKPYTAVHAFRNRVREASCRIIE